MKKRFFLFIVTFVLALVLSACTLSTKDVELGASVSFNHEMAEKTSQKVTVEMTDKAIDTSELVVSYTGLNPEIAEISSEGVIKAHKPGEAEFEVELVLGESSKVIEFKVTVLAIEYYITYELNGGQNSELNPEGFAESELPLELHPATKAGYTFKGWEYEGEVVETIPAGTTRNVKLVATWEVVEYALSFDLAGGKAENLPSKYTVEEAVELPAPAKAGYEFAGWYAGEELVEQIEAGTTGDLELVAKWEVVEYSISYDLAGGELAGEAVSKYTVEQAVELPKATKPEYRFLGWYAGEELVEKIEAGTTGDLELVAKWELDKYSISYDLAGGEVAGAYVYDESKATQEFKLTKYINYDVNGLAASLRDKANLTWWGHIALKATEDPEVFEIIQIANKSTGITEEFDYVIAWHSACTDATSKATMDAILKASAEYVGDYVVIKGIPAEAGDAEMTVKVFEASDISYESALVSEYTQNDEIVLAEPTRLGYEFAGWYKGEERIEKIEKGSFGDIALVAKWEAIEYAINYDAQGGDLGFTVYTYATICSEFLAEYNKLADQSLTATTFAKESSASVKVVFANAEFLAKWSWMFAFMLEDLKAANPDATSAYLTDAYPVLEKMIAGDTAAILDNANARTMIRNYIGGMLLGAKGCPSNDVFQKYATDFADAARQEALVKAANAANEFKYTVEDEVTLVVPTKEGHKFLGWYAGEKLVEKIEKGTTGDLTLVAKWEAEAAPVESEIEYVLDGGENAEGAPTSYIEGEGLEALPVPTKAGHKFLGWYIGEELVESISKEQTGKVTLTAKWEAVESATYEITYDLAGGEWLVINPESHEEIKAIFLVDMRDYLVSLGQNVTEISPEDQTLAPDGNMTDFFGISYNQREQMNAFFTSHEVYAARWGWMYNYVAQVSGKDLTDQGNLRSNIHAFVYGMFREKWPASYDFSNVSYGDYKDLIPADLGISEVGPAQYKAGEALEIPAPGREDYEFAGWKLDGQDFAGITEETTGNLVLVATWKKAGEIFFGNVLEVGAGKEYESLDAAIQAAQNGDIIKLGAGEYTLSVVIDKTLKIVGPNADLAPNKFAEAEALINVAKDIAGNLAGEYIEFNGVHLKGTGGGAGIPGISFQDGGNIKSLVFKSCVISDTNTFLKFVGGASNLELVMDSCHIHTIGQFVLWTTTAINKTLLVNNVVDGHTCGAVTNAAAALFRVRFGSLEAYHNVFNGDSLNAPGYFECSAEASVVKYNLFNDVLLFVHPTATNNVVFDQNLYISKGAALDKAPVSLTGTGVTADATLAKSEEELDNLYLNYLLTSNPNRYFEITFDAQGGEFETAVPSVYDKEQGIAELPKPVRPGFTFLGWYDGEEKVEYVAAGTKGKLALVAKWSEDALIVDGTTAAGHYATIADALAAAKEGAVIKIVAGEYAEDITINIANLTIKGPNEGVNAVSGTRAAEAVIKGVWTITSGASNLVIDGLAFTGNAKVKYDESKAYVGFTFQNNKVYDTKESEQAWDESRYTLPGFIQFTFASGGYVKNAYILNNSFVNVSEVNVLANRAINLSVDGNLFKDFDLDAIRIEGGYSYGSLAFTNNVFEQTTKETGNVGIFLYSVAGSSNAEKALVLIANNEFINVGKDNGTVFTAAVCAYRFQENYTTFAIENNVFDHCYDYLYLRNNGGNNEIWFCTVENNQFLGLPHNQYYGSYRDSDSESTNPHLAVFTQNYYEDNDGKVITDLSAYAAYFKHMGSYGTALEAKPADSSVEAVKFYQISYELNEGTTKETLVKEYSALSLEYVVLPTLTKPNHQFNGWLLNGEVVTALPEGTAGDLHLVADFTVLEGELYEITLVNEKENAVWPSRGAEDREEIISELFGDLYEWAQGNGETRSYADYEAYIREQLEAYADINLRNTELGNYPAEDGSTEYFFNIPKYYQKWNEFFAVFHDAMLKVNSSQSFYTDTYATMVRLYQFVTWSSTGQSYFAGSLPKMLAATKVPAEIPTSYRGGQVVTLPVLSMENGLAFLGWYDNAEYTGEPITQISAIDSGAKTFYAKWDKEVLAEQVEINSISELLLFTTHQLVWTITPENTTNKEVEFFSSNEAVATVNAKGLITALANGTTTITVRIYGNRELDVKFDVQVYVNDYIDGSYESNSYAEVGQNIQLNAEIIKKDGTKAAVSWKSLTPEIATVDANGVVTTVKAGIAKIVAYDANDEALDLEFGVTVLEAEQSEVLDFILGTHESNIFTRYNLGIGSGTPDYYMDIFGSVNKILGNEALEIDDSRKDMEVEAKTGDYFESMTSIEFITVHYTGNMAAGADAKANANYFVGKNDVSIHYTTGNDGVYQCLDHSYGGYHAGDSGALAQVGAFKWIPSGVKVAEGDPLYPEFTISQDFYYEINGQKTTIPMARPWDYKERGTDHILNADGTISSQSNFGQTGFANRDPESFINDQGLPFKVENGEYYMGTTWWCYTQVYEGRICSTGGNRNSIGIESCVNKGSDLWYTWQLTAKLVAKLMLDNNLDITRVRGHHFYSGKDCPQPMLANDCEIWREFLELVEAEYELLTKYSDYEIKFESHNPEILDNNGRIIKQPSETTTVSYTVTITKDGKTESVTLSSVIKGMYVDR